MSTTEQATLIYVLRGHDSGRLHEGLFADGKNREVFRTIRALQQRGEVADIATVGAALPQDFPRSYLVELVEAQGLIGGQSAEAAFRADVNALIRAAGEGKAKRLLLEAAKEPYFLPRLKEILADYEPEDFPDVSTFSISAAVHDFEGFLDNKRAGKFWGHEIKCFPLLTRVLSGLREIIVLSAKPKVGKSTFALQLASDVHGQGVSVLYFDFENGRFNLMAREASRKSGFSLAEIYAAAAGGEAKIAGAVMRLADDYKDFAIITDRALTIEKVRAQVKQMRRLTGRDDVFVVVDSLQKLPMSNLRERRAAIDSWLRGFEELKAEDPRLSILLISELSRQGGQPKESGDIEYTGHFLLELQADQSEEDIQKHGDNGTRNLFIRAARDVEIPGGPITYRADFGRWKFIENGR